MLPPPSVSAIAACPRCPTPFVIPMLADLHRLNRHVTSTLLGRLIRTSASCSISHSLVPRSTFSTLRASSPAIMSASLPKAYPQNAPGVSLSSGLALPFPARFPGFRLGSPSAPVQVEVYIDLQCPYSAKAFSTLLTVHSSNVSTVSFLFIPMCLPTHRQAFQMLKSSLAAAVRGAELNPGPGAASAAWVKYVSFLYGQVDRFSSGGHYENKTGGDLVNHVSRCVLEFFKEEEERFDVYHALIEGEQLDAWAKEPMRLAAKRGVNVTPTYFVNSVQAALLESSTSPDAWAELINTLVKQGGVMS